MTLSGVPETALWTLYHRSIAARNGVLQDPKAIELVDALDHPFKERYGGGDRFLSSWQGLRVRAFDREVRRFLAAHPDGTVVALGEGLETQFWRVDNGRVRWVSVDLPESVALRERLLGRSPRQTVIASSATDPGWIERVSGDLLISAQGLLMYLDRDAVHHLFAALPPAALVFDLVSKQAAARTAKPHEGYQPPPWTYSVDAAELASLPVADLRRLALPHGRGALAGFWLPLASRLPGVRTALLSVYSARTIAASSSTAATPAATSTTSASTSAATPARAAVRAMRRDA